MNPKISERSFEEAIEAILLETHRETYVTGNAPVGFDAGAPPYGDMVPGGYHKRQPEDYNRKLCLIARDVLDFIYATQPKEWEKLKQHHGADVKERRLRRNPPPLEHG